MLGDIEEVFMQCLNLRVLDLSVNHIQEIKNLDKCAQLQELKMSNNRVERLRMGLSGLEKLKVLDISMNRIRVMEGFSSLVSLEKLVMYGNEIEEVQGLENCGAMKHIDISRNRVSKTLTNLGFNGSLRRNLEVLNACHN
jgi:hypothetical protein